MIAVHEPQPPRCSAENPRPRRTTASWLLLWGVAFACIPFLDSTSAGEGPSAKPSAQADTIAQPKQDRKAFTFEQTLRGRGIDLSGRVDRYQWALDQRHLQLRVGDRTVWFDPSDLSTEKEPTPAPTPEPSPRQRFVKAWTAAGRETPADRVFRRAKFSTGGSTPDRSWILAEWGRGDAAQVWTLSPDGKLSSVDLPDERRLVELAPDGSRVSWIEGYDLAWRDLTSTKKTAVSSDGTQRGFRYGLLDWVYQEEIYGRGRWKGYWWSPNGDSLAFLRLDEKEVIPFTLVDHVPVRSKTEVTAYPKAGDPNPKVALGVADRSGATRWLDLSQYSPSDEILIVRVGWTPDSSRVVFAVQNRTQNWLDLNIGDPKTGRVERWIREESDSWVNVFGLPRWLEDGSFLWTSERTGYAHLYHYGADGQLIRPVTLGKPSREWAVRNVIRVDESRGWLWFTGATNSGAESHAFRVRLDGSDFQALTHGAGTHRITLNEDGSAFLDRYSSIEVPTQLRLCSGDGRSVEILSLARIAALDEYDYRAPEFVRIPARDGYPLEAMVILPANFDPTKRYPVWLPTYSGPDAPTVRHRWQSSVFDQFLAQQGLIVFKVNNRSSSGRGLRDTANCFRRLGESELEDLTDALDWLVKERGADRERVGISGWSYGGFMAAYALTHSDRFALGVAGAGVYDWRNYDTVYTERFMSTPQENEAGYKLSSCVESAANLSGHLVLVHGTIDDNVHVQNTHQMVYALQRAGKHFDLMLYPRSRHGLGSSAQRNHFKVLTWRAIQEHLLGDAKESN